jgi:hypothetical protein
MWAVCSDKPGRDERSEVEDMKMGEERDRETEIGKHGHEGYAGKRREVAS